MRTTLNLNDDLVRKAKQRAAAEDRTLTSVIEDALRRLLDGGGPDRQGPYKIQLLTPSELQPGLDPNDPVFYREVLEQEDIEKYRPQARAPSSINDAAL